MTTEDTLDEHYTYHAPASDDVHRHQKVRTVGRYLAGTILANAPCSDERDNALDRVREAVMWANAAIACNKGDDQ